MKILPFCNIIETDFEEGIVLASKLVRTGRYECRNRQGGNKEVWVVDGGPNVGHTGKEKHFVGNLPTKWYFDKSVLIEEGLAFQVWERGGGI